jgi:phenylacetic acid degradation operon negative regulatory protein
VNARLPPGDVGGPRTQAGPNPQHLLATVLGEYLDSSDADLPSAVVVAILREFGISESSARAALSRLAKRGLIAVRKTGRSSSYHLTPQAIARHRSRMRHFLEFGAAPPTWTGDWVTVSFSVPQTGQSLRHVIRKTLGGLGFVRLYDSVWIRPGADTGSVNQAMEEVVDQVEGARWSVMRTRFDQEVGPHGPAAAYDLTGLVGEYESFIEQYRELRLAVRRGEVDKPQALVARTSVMDSWRRFPDLDPDLPEHLLPVPWPRHQARKVFLEIHSALGSLAEARLVEIATPYWPDAASWITHFQAGRSSTQIN